MSLWARLKMFGIVTIPALVCCCLLCATMTVAKGNSAVRSLRLVEVESFGAVGDSVADDRQAFLDAIASIPPEGGTLVLRPGRWYHLADNVVIAKDSITVFGYGAGVWCDRKTTIGGVLGFLGSKSKRVEGGGVYGLSVVCKPDSNLTQNEDALFAAWSKGVTFRDCRVIYANRKGIVDHHSIGTRVLYNRIDSAGFAGISMEFGDAIPDSGGHQEIVGNTIGVVYRRDVGPIQQPNIVNDSLWEGSGIAVSSISPAYGLMDGPSICDNHVGYAPKAGVYVHLTRNALITGNIVDSARYGIVVMQSIHPTVRENTFLSVDSVGVWVRSPAGRGSLENNRIVSAITPKAVLYREP